MSRMVMLRVTTTEEVVVEVKGKGNDDWAIEQARTAHLIEGEGTVLSSHDNATGEVIDPDVWNDRYHNCTCEVCPMCVWRDEEEMERAPNPQKFVSKLRW